MTAIVTLTMNPAIDKSASVPHVVPEHKLRCGPPSAEPGGGGINVSRAIHQLGGTALALYPAGGLTGQSFQDLLDTAGLPHQPIPIAEATRESFSFFEAATTLQYRFNIPGPTLQEEEWQQCLDALRHLTPRPTYLVASGSLPPGVPDDFYGRVACIGNQLGAQVIVDTSGEALCAAVREGDGIYLIKPNLKELSDLAGHALEDEVHQEAAAQEIIARGPCQVIVVSLGAAGVLLVTAETVERMRTPTVPIKSKVGAGDSMVAGITLSLARGLPLREAIRFGLAAGAAAVMTPGSELCRREDTERLYAQMHRATA
jgi:6-phosphofructokinase 2